ncbi:hypothetical protein G5V59_18750 [Nocardioides sp. W3-2-3]|uniref:hypothetical protein n=1 Tax=Nocardioides convexus TaxID=2712224 RepID=UPI00241861AA|nr:hypothetical protein [Nocardioides convexus]NHA01201.1 hypothetical protein [Nocardioides convexus]
MGSPDRTHWHVSTDTAVDETRPGHRQRRAALPAPGHHRDERRGRDLAAQLRGACPPSPSAETPPTAETSPATSPRRLAVNPWSRRVQVDCIGVAEEAVAMDERIELLPDRCSRLTRDRRSPRRRRHHGRPSNAARHRRVHRPHRQRRRRHLARPDAAARRSRRRARRPRAVCCRLVNDHVGQSATSIVVAGERPNTPGAVLHMTNTGRVVLEHAGLNLIAVGLTSDEARGCALVYAQSEVAEDVPMPVDETATDGWEAYTDASGALRREYTLPRNTPADAVDEPLSSLLEGEDEDYIRQSAIVQEDLETLAPKVPAHVRAEVEQSDPDLDQDIADWFSTDCDRPRLTLLGPVAARTRGKALAKRKPYFTELLAFLALHRKHGATREQIREAFSISDGKVRDYTNIVRDWLGTNPRTGEDHLPYADKAPAAKVTGINVYQVDDGLLVDLDLFLRLRKRGQARGGAEGVADLCTALENRRRGQAVQPGSAKKDGHGWPTSPTASTSWRPAGSPTSPSSS